MGVRKMDRKAAIKEYGNLINQAREAKYRYNAKVEHRFDPTERDKEKLIREYHNLRALARSSAFCISRLSMGFSGRFRERGNM